MKHARSIPLFLLFLASAAIADELVTIKDFEAVDHIGEKVEVRGVVSAIRTSQMGWILIDLGGKYPNQLFVGSVKPDTLLSTEKAFLKLLEGKEIGLIGRIMLVQATPGAGIHTKDQIKVKWKEAREDAFDFLNGVVNDRYRKELGLLQPLNKTELWEFKTYLDHNVENWQDKKGAELWKLVPKILQSKKRPD
jgi:hypothetical protein